MAQCHANPLGPMYLLIQSPVMKEVLADCECALTISAMPFDLFTYSHSGLNSPFVTNNLCSQEFWIRQ